MFRRFLREIRRNLVIQSNIEGGKNVWKVEFPPLGDGRFAHNGGGLPRARAISVQSPFP